MASEAERCAKPGCGALRVLGNPCTDWDCPQLFVVAAEHKSLLSRLAELEEALRPFASADIDVSGTAAIGVTASDILAARAALDGEGWCSNRPFCGNT